MAISVLIEADEFRPLYHSIFFRLDSTLKAQTNFKYVFKVTANGQPEFKVKVSPKPINGYGELDLRQRLQDYIDQDIFDLTDSDFQKAACVEYTLKIDEEYTDGSGNQVVNPDVQVFSEKIAYNTILTRNELFGNLSQYQIDTGSPGELLLNLEELSTMYKDDVYFVHFTGRLAPIFKPAELQIQELDNANSVLATTTVTGDEDENCQLVRVDLDAISFNANTTKIRFRLLNTDSNPVTNFRTFFVKERPCTTYTPIKLIYLDSKGSYNSINLDGISNESFNWNVKTFRKFIDPATDSETSRGVQRYFQDETKRLILNTLILDDKATLAVLDLIRSNRVFIDLRNAEGFENVDFFPIEILKNSLQPLKTENGDVIQYSIQARFAFEQVNR